jgi:hypothetical protein
MTTPNSSIKSAATGPITPEGKSISAQNSRKHGLYSAQLKVPDEYQAEYNQTLESHRKLHAPSNDREEAMVLQLVNDIWLLFTAQKLEYETTQRLLSDPENEKLQLALERYTRRRRMLERSVSSLEIALIRSKDQRFEGSLIERYAENELCEEITVPISLPAERLRQSLNPKGERLYAGLPDLAARLVAQANHEQSRATASFAQRN